jgi:hypothetical protein
MRSTTTATTTRMMNRTYRHTSSPYAFSPLPTPHPRTPCRPPQQTRTMMRTHATPPSCRRPRRAASATATRATRSRTPLSASRSRRLRSRARPSQPSHSLSAPATSGLRRARSSSLPSALPPLERRMWPWRERTHEGGWGACVHVAMLPVVLVSSRYGET